jgi:hypothetical protein
MSALRAVLGRPVVKAALMSGCVMAVGDLSCQTIVRYKAAQAAAKSSSSRKVVEFLQGNDWDRTARFGMLGITLHGPFFLYGFRWLDRSLAPLLGQTVSLRTSAVKAIAGNLSIFPVYVSTFYFYMGMLEGLSPREAVSKVQRCFWPSFSTGFLFWATANLANFQFVPPTSRVYYVSACGLLWNSYLSWANQQYGRTTAATVDPDARRQK